MGRVVQRERRVSRRRQSLSASRRPLADGPVAGCVVTCPWHGWQYDLTSGALMQDPAVCVTRHEARVVGDEIQVRLTG
jgi:nitrite reductase/ring-hydroxylating ferredoxin subunit